jgi:predicted TPR repeat methyltransferase
MLAAKAAFQGFRQWAGTEPKFAALLRAGVPPVEAFARWSLELMKSNRFSEARAVLQVAQVFAPADPVLWVNNGIALSRSNFPGEAAKCFEYSLALSPNQPDTWLLLGLARKQQGDLAGAQAAYQVSLDQEANSPVAWELMVVVKEEQRDFAGAVECLNLRVKLGGVTAAILANLGRLRYQVGQFAESCRAYEKAARLEPGNLHHRQMWRNSAFLRDAIRCETVEEALANYRKSFPAGESAPETEVKNLVYSAFSLLSGFGYLEAAARVGRKHLQLWPGSHSLRYLLTAVTAGDRFDRSPPECVVEQFDAFAEGFEAQLVGVLGYNVPAKLCSAIRGMTPAKRMYATLDAGVGTGLCGPLLRPLSRTLTGVDLSSKMLEQASKKGVYDTLACEELVSYLRRSANQFDLIVAADVIIYFGDLTEIFSSAAKALRPGGLLAISTELSAGERYRLLPTGRFAHPPEYVASQAGPMFVEALRLETPIRLEANRPLPGNLFIFRRR